MSLESTKGSIFRQLCGLYSLGSARNYLKGYEQARKANFSQKCQKTTQFLESTFAKSHHAHLQSIA